MKTTDDEKITEEQWKQRYIDCIMKHSNTELWQAEESANAAWDYVTCYGGDESPEEAARNELELYE